MLKKGILLFIIISCIQLTRADHLLLPMDHSQSDHLKAYGLAFWILEHQVEVDWLLNYRGGSFMCKYAVAFEQELQIRGITYEKISEGYGHSCSSNLQ